MPQGQGPRACAHHLVGVVALAVTPRAFGKRRPAPRASLRSLAGVDAPAANAVRRPCNRLPDVYTPGMTEFDSANAWIQNFDDGNQNDDDKNNDLRARAVRK